MSPTLIRAVVLALLCAALPARAAYPEKAVKFIVGYAPGGATDIIARLLSNALPPRWGQQVVVETKTGASGMIAADQVVHAAPDGYTLLMAYTPEVSLNKLVFKDMRYDPVTDLTAIALVASAPLVLVSGPKLPVDSMQALLKYKGPPLTYGSPGIGGQQHLAGEMLGKLTGMQVTHVPYRGTSLAVADLLGGQIDLFFATTPPLLQNIRAGKLHPLAVAGPAREKLLPDVPTVVELGMPRLQMTNWFGLFGPKAMPPAVTAKIAGEVAALLADPAMVKALEEQGLTPTLLQGAAFRGFIDSEISKYQGIVAETGVKAQ